MKIIYYFIFLFCSIPAFTQNTFSKVYHFDTYPRAWTRDSKIDTNKIIVLNHITCYPDTICTSISHLDFDGNLQYFNVLTNFQIAQEDALYIDGDSLFVLGYFVEPINAYRSIDVLKSDKALADFRVFTYGDTTENALATGLRKIDNEYYIYGNVYEYETELSKAQVIRLNEDLDVVWDKRYRYENHPFINVAFSLHKTPDDNLAFMNFSEISTSEAFEIIKIDKAGERLGSYAFLDTEIDLSPIVFVSQEGDYYFTSHYIPQTDFPHYPARINKLNPDMETLEWSYLIPAIPETGSRLHVTNEIIQASNGDIIACGSVYDYLTENDQDSKWNGFILRLSQDGELLNYNMYKVPSDVNPEELGQYKNSALYGIEETDTGGFVGYGAVTYLDFDESIPLDMWILSVNEHGCLDGFDCGEEITVLTATETPQAVVKTPTLFPNPSTDFIHIKNSAYTQYRIFDNQGHFITKGNRTAQIDIQDLPSGVYYLELIHRHHIFQTLKFIKQ